MDKYQFFIKIRTAAGKKKCKSKTVCAKNYSEAFQLLLEQFKMPKGYYRYGNITCVHTLNHNK